MKREQIVKQIEVKAASIYGKEYESVKVCTRGEIYPKCFVGSMDEHGICTKQITPAFLPTALLAYVHGVNDGMELALQRMLNK